MTGAAFPPLALDGRIGHYLAEIRRFPMLQAAEEVRLATRWREQGDEAAAQLLITSHLRLVAKIAMGYRFYGLPLSELIAEGNLGMMHAVKRFDPARGFRLTTYAMWWVRAQIQEYVLRSWSLVRTGTTGAQKRLFFNLRKLKTRLQAIEEGDLSPENVTRIAQALDVSEAEVVSMNSRLAGPDASLNAARSEGGDAWQDRLIDEAEDQEARLGRREELGLRRNRLRLALTHLNPRERDIVAARRLREQPVTREALAQRHGVSPERVRQIEFDAIAKLEKLVHRQSRAPALPVARQNPNLGLRLSRSLVSA
jgi:RNA polymerase sigma-32 factor